MTAEGEGNLYSDYGFNNNTMVVRKCKEIIWAIRCSPERKEIVSEPVGH
jgi:hypothetical protein